MRLAGDVQVGRNRPDAPTGNMRNGGTTFLRDKGYPTGIRTLVHDTTNFHPLPSIGPFPFCDVHVNGDCNKDPPGSSDNECTDDGCSYGILPRDDRIIRSRPPVVDTCPYPMWFSSYAPLEGVRRVHLFLEPGEEGYCRGLLFEYDNGGQRAVGQCRVCIDPVRTFENPKRIAWSKAEEEEGSRKRVTFDEQESEDAEWAVSDMVGTLGFYYEGPKGGIWLSVSPLREDPDNSDD